MIPINQFGMPGLDPYPCFGPMPIILKDSDIGFLNQPIPIGLFGGPFIPENHFLMPPPPPHIFNLQPGPIGQHVFPIHHNGGHHHHDGQNIFNLQPSPGHHHLSSIHHNQGHHHDAHPHLSSIHQKRNYPIIGPRGEEVYKIKYGEETYYVKKNLDPQQIENFKRADDLGIGVPAELGMGKVKMKKGISINDAIRNGYLSKETAIQQVLDLQNKLKNQEMAHCDVKYDNLKYFPHKGKILFIDNGELAHYGERRLVKCNGENTTLYRPFGVPGIVGPGTDGKGFQRVIERIHG